MSVEQKINIVFELKEGYDEKRREELVKQILENEYVSGDFKENKNTIYIEKNCFASYSLFKAIKIAASEIFREFKDIVERVSGVVYYLEEPDDFFEF